MKSEKKKVALTLFSVLFSVLVLSQTSSIESFAYTGAEKVFTTESITYSAYSPYSQEIDYRYKVENGKLYRRLYNYYTQQWIGEWELCP
jgi:hypothetical protein